MTEENKRVTNIKNLVEEKPGYTSPLDYALSAVGNMDTQPISVPILATEDMLEHACKAVDIDPRKARMVYEIMTQAAQEDYEG